MITSIRRLWANFRIRNRALSDFSRREVLYYEFGIGEEPGPPPERDIVQVQRRCGLDELLDGWGMELTLSPEQKAHWQALMDAHEFDWDFDLMEQLFAAYDELSPDKSQSIINSAQGADR